MTSSTASAEHSTSTKTVYVLRLEDEKYYVGATADIDHRVRQHRRGQGAKWTQKHEVVDLVALARNISNWQSVEKELTLWLMERYHWTDVRGGPWTQRSLSSPPNDIEK
jgi:predicted GIY-YIG superfamily endonuclease